MKVILLQTIPRIGESGKMQTVPDGYARNYLFPKRLAVPATQERVAQQERDEQKKKVQQQLTLEKVKELAKKLQHVTIDIPARTNTEGHLYGAIHAAYIQQKLAERHMHVPKQAIHLPRPFDTIGTYTVPVHLDNGISVPITILIHPEHAS
jgi:large subunit ribosomal protein L9